MKLKTVGLVLALVWGSTMSVALAHHSNAGASKAAEVKGILRSVEFVNPHSSFTLEARDASGKVVMWNFGSQPPAWFRKAGIKKSDFAKGIGHQVTVSAIVPADGTPAGLLTKMTFEDGTSVGFKLGN